MLLSLQDDQCNYRRTLDRHRGAAVASFIPVLSCRHAGRMRRLLNWQGSREQASPTKKRVGHRRHVLIE
jgi:hypothetical protein